MRSPSEKKSGSIVDRSVGSKFVGAELVGIFTSPAGIENCGTRSSDYFKSLAQVVRERLCAVGCARRGQLRHGKAMS
jgi:hypothetical protein